MDAFIRKNVVGLAAALCCFAAPLSGGGGHSAEVVPEAVKGIDYRESLETFNNPERGFYVPQLYSFKQTGNACRLRPGINLYHLRLDLSEFGAKSGNGGKGRPLSPDALDCFKQMLQSVRRNNASAIVRFAYDPRFSGNNVCEPDLAVILHHLEQLGAVIAAQTETVACVETGMLGKWGELHGSPQCTRENLNAIITQWLKVLPPEITVNVRTPGHFAAWAGIDRTALIPGKSPEGTPARRVGIYNDGYLGSSTDLGTFQNREREIVWLGSQAAHTLYGGELVAWFEKGKTPLNTAAYIAREGFLTHTSYLNSEWNGRVLQALRREIYNGDDPLYKGKNGYLYVENHLGYRWVLRASAVSPFASPGGEAVLRLRIENVGFGNLVNRKLVSVVLCGSGKYRQETVTALDPRRWLSRTTADAEIRCQIPAHAPQGTARLFLRISRHGDLRKGNYQCVRLANPGIWNAELGANFVGTVQVR